MGSGKNTKKIEPWRVIVFAIAVVCIVAMWVKKDVAALYATVSREQLLPLVVTTVAVSLLKVAVIAGVILLIKWLVGKIKKK